MIKSGKIALVANTSWSLYNFRLGLARALKAKGMEVVLIAPFDNYTSKLIAEGFRFVPLSFQNYGTDPLSELKLLFQLFKIYKKEKPDFIFHYTIKPNLYGTIAAWLHRIPSIAVTTGLGRLLSTENPIVKTYANRMYRLTGQLAQEVWFLNKSDLNYFIKNRLVKRKKARLLPSEGVDTERFRPMPEYQKNDGITRFLFAGRLIAEKGIYEYVEAARQVRKSNSHTRFQILGFIDSDNPEAITVEELEAWQTEGVIEFLGAAEDVRPFIAAADCVVLPSNREGVSRILLEAAAMAKPIIATDVPGCREVVRDQVTGFLVEKGSVSALKNACEKIIAYTEEDIIALGEAGRALVAKTFSEERVIGVYSACLARVTLSEAIFEKVIAYD